MKLRVQRGSYSQKTIAIHRKAHEPFRLTPPRMKKALFEILENKLIDFAGHSFADIYSGSAQIGLEALSRGFGKVYFCEIDFERRKHIRNLLREIGCPKHRYDVFSDNRRFLQKLLLQKLVYPGTLVVFADPPYPKERNLSAIYELLAQELGRLTPPVLAVFQAPKEVAKKFPQARVYFFGSNCLILPQEKL
ncbi:MAG: RsmD family RNA methyltransferase [Leptospiraceae bacterium]|nr:RsmD family RNA methyltransferase [Leptospiraceae bacterium]MDW8307382.1 RsmD family RNA methyltransferase [Leptospiraceae bacterium]